MKSKIRKTALILLSVLFWFALWEIIARIVDSRVILPTASETLRTLWHLLFKAEFYTSIFFSFVRIFIGFLLGFIIGVVSGILTNHSKVFDYIISPIMTVARSTPVASIIIILWFIVGESFFLGKDGIPIIIGALMVMPVIYQSTYNGLSNTSEMLCEVGFVFEFNWIKKVRYIIFPSLRKFLIPGLLTSTGLAWKAGIAAEIITLTKNSIGKNISNAKNSWEGAEMLAWTLTVIFLSIIIESTLKYFLKKTQINETDNQ